MCCCVSVCVCVCVCVCVFSYVFPMYFMFFLRFMKLATLSACLLVKLSAELNAGCMPVEYQLNIS
jgi:hypothetical protein